MSRGARTRHRIRPASFLASTRKPDHHRLIVAALRVLLVLVLFAIYAVGHVVLRNRFGDIYASAALIPITFAILYYGVWGGTAAGVLAIAVNAVLLGITGEGMIRAASALVMSGISVGYGVFGGILRDAALAGRESRELLKRAFEAAQDGLWECHIPTHGQYFSPRWFTMLGYEPDVFPHTLDVFKELVHPDDREQVFSKLTEAGELGKPKFSLTFRMRAYNGSYIWILSRGKVVEFDASGRGIRMVGVHSDVSSLKRAESDLVYLAYHDELTGLLNRKAFYERAAQTLDQLGRSNEGSQCAFLMLDLDNFKDVNDSYGHDFGDELLRAVGKRLQERLRKSDMLFRLGGDEFTILLTRVSRPTDAALVASNLVRAFAEPLVIGDQSVYTAISVGISVFPRDGESVPELMRKADTALYDSKIEKNTYRFYTMKMQNEALTKMELITALRQAIDEEQFCLYYQPVLRGDGSLAGAEALLRWEDPRLGLRLPHEFLQTAEESGAILRIGRWVLLQACLDADHWNTLGLGGIKVAVNLSPIQLLSRSITDDVALALAASGIDPSQLELELTESSFIEPSETSTRMLSDLMERGITVAIDDFGTGYSSLSYLKHLPASTLKIDRSFVLGLPMDPEDVSIVRAVVTMAHGLGLNLVAEGVDGAAQIAFLRELGCDLFQGYYFAKPMPAERFVQYAMAHLRLDRTETGSSLQRQQKASNQQKLKESWNEKRNSYAELLSNKTNEPLEESGTG